MTATFLKITRLVCCCFFILMTGICFARENVVNIYAWSGEIPENIIQQFEQETGIKINISTFENNEIMYAKIRTTAQSGYDLIMPSSYFVDRMRRQNMLEKLDKTKLTNWKNLDTAFFAAAYDPGAQFSLPFIWGVTGIFYNSQYFASANLKKWSDLWRPEFKNQLLLLDDTREIFSMALLSLGYSPNDRDPQHIKAAYLQLKKLMPNVKVFSADTVVSILIDEDATVGMAWNGDVFKASTDNKAVKFIFPAEGFVIWVDTFAMPKNAPHKDAAYTFLNFMLRPDVAKAVALDTSFPITNKAAQQNLPAEIRDNPVIYPPKSILQHGQFQTDVGDETLALYEKYWEALKMGG